MRQPKIKELLELVTNVAVLLAATAVLGALTWGYFMHKSSPSLEEGFQRGQILAAPPQVDYSGAAQTLLIAMNTNCHFCTESIPFYNELTKSQQARSTTTRIIALFPNEANEVKHYLQQNHLQMEIATRVNFRALNVNGTPTVILVDKHGKIIDFWTGKLSNEIEQQVISAINSL